MCNEILTHGERGKSAQDGGRGKLRLWQKANGVLSCMWEFKSRKGKLKEFEKRRGKGGKLRGDPFRRDG